MLELAVVHSELYRINSCLARWSSGSFQQCLQNYKQNTPRQTTAEIQIKVDNKTTMSFDLLEGANCQRLSFSALVEKSLVRGEAMLANNGALVVETGAFTGRSPGDKFIVDDSITHSSVDWGKTNQPFDSAKFDTLLNRVVEYLKEKDVFVFDGHAGASPEYGLPLTVYTEFAWHSVFANALFLSGDSGEGRQANNGFTVINAAGFRAIPERDGTKSSTFIILNFSRRIALIGGTEYAGEIKKSVFTALNFLLPERHVFPMHCSANVGADGRTALFFGLSGTGKTTLSADPARSLIGDDEHGWGDEGVFNFEGGCYAKCIHLSEASEPEIWAAVRYGTVLENVDVDPITRQLDYNSKKLTENTRAAYPLNFIPNAIIPSVGPHPKTVIFLTADAFGVLPPIAKLTRDQAMYHFLSGYTSKLAGTERGITTPQATFSTCFGAPFMSRPPAEYAKMLGERLDLHEADCYLVNTGWSGGPYGVGKRMDLSLTRAMVTAALDGTLSNVEFESDPIFGVLVPLHCPSVPASLLHAKSTWPNPVEYDEAAKHLASLFQQNFLRFTGVAPEIVDAGPRLPLKGA
jgi:phosphoenolpyruvate carboxykinase (ATP)